MPLRPVASVCPALLDMLRKHFKQFQMKFQIIFTKMCLCLHPSRSNAGWSTQLDTPPCAYGGRFRHSGCAVVRPHLAMSVSLCMTGCSLADCHSFESLSDWFYGNTPSHLSSPLVCLDIVCLKQDPRFSDFLFWTDLFRPKPYLHWSSPLFCLEFACLKQNQVFSSNFLFHWFSLKQRPLLRPLKLLLERRIDTKTSETGSMPKRKRSNSSNAQ